MNTQLGFVLIAVGVFLEALRTGPSWLDSSWLGTALIVLGAVAILFTWVQSKL